MVNNASAKQKRYWFSSVVEKYKLEIEKKGGEKTQRGYGGVEG